MPLWTFEYCELMEKRTNWSEFLFCFSNIKTLCDIKDGKALFLSYFCRLK